MKILETPRLVLRHLTSEDAGFIFGLVTDKSFIDNIGDRGFKVLDDAEQYIARIDVTYKTLGYGLYLVELKESLIPIGICGLVKRDTLVHPDIGFAFMPQFWRKGFAYESSLAVLEYAKNTLKLERVLGVTKPDNRPSIGVLEKLGLKFDKLTRLTADAPESKLFSMDLKKDGS